MLLAAGHQNIYNESVTSLMNSPWLRKYNLLTFDAIDSTNSEAIRLIKAGARGDHIIYASSQTAGRGRHGRSWVSEFGNLYLTLILDRDLTLTILPQLSFVTGLAARETISYFAKTNNNKVISLKWPNDILYNGKKISGILLESIKFKQKNYLIIGIGINIVTYPTSLNATSLLAEGIINKKHGQELNIFMNNFDKFFAVWQMNGFAKIKAKWLKYAEHLNKIVSIDDDNNKITGIFKGIDGDGAIILELNNGEEITIHSGEVWHQ